MNHIAYKNNVILVENIETVFFEVFHLQENYGATDENDLEWQNDTNRK